MATAAPARTPWHLWAVGVLSLAWNAFGAYDYLMTQTRNADWLAMMTEAQRTYVEGFPIWMEVAWALGVWGAVLGSLLLLIRSRYAYWSFVVSVIGLFVATVYQFILSPVPDMNGMAIGMTVAIWVVALALLIYSYRMQTRAVLR